VIAASNALRLPVVTMRIATAAMLLAGGMHALNSPVLIQEEERLVFLEIPELVSTVQQDVANSPSDSIRLLAHLPTDYPARFYIETRGIEETLAAAPVSLSPTEFGAVEWIPVARTPGVAPPRRFKLLRTRGPVE
jgi:hypothetical protein